MKRIPLVVTAIMLCICCVACAFGEKNEQRSSETKVELAEYDAVSFYDNEIQVVSRESDLDESESDTDIVSAVETAEKTQEQSEICAVPSSAGDLVRKQYKDVKESLAEAGFEDIKAVECHADGYSEGEVVSVSIGGSEDYDRNDEFSKWAEVVISYAGAVQTTAATTTVTSSHVTTSENKVTVPEKEETIGNLVWVPTNGGKKYHRSASCSNMVDPMQVSVETAKANGFTACKKCYK